MMKHFMNNAFQVLAVWVPEIHDHTKILPNPDQQAIHGTLFV
jgi:hypothetical protein